MKRWLALSLILALARPGLCFHDASQLPVVSKSLCQLSQAAYFQLVHDKCSRSSKGDVVDALLDLGRAVPAWEALAVQPFPDLPTLRKLYAPICGRIGAINAMLSAKPRGWRISPAFVNLW